MIPLILYNGQFICIGHVIRIQNRFKFNSLFTPKAFYPCFGMPIARNHVKFTERSMSLMLKPVNYADTHWQFHLQTPFHPNQGDSGLFEKWLKPSFTEQQINRGYINFRIRRWNLSLVQKSGENLQTAWYEEFLLPKKTKWRQNPHWLNPNWFPKGQFSWLHPYHCRLHHKTTHRYFRRIWHDDSHRLLRLC